MLQLSLLEFLWCLVPICSSFSLFHVVCSLVERVFSHPSWPELVHKHSKDSKRQLTLWRRRNTSISFVHSFIAGAWSLFAVVFYPETTEDITFAINGGLRYLVLFSMGYFLYDAKDMIKNDPSRRTHELLIHHGVTLLAFSCSVISKKYYAYAAVALLMEVNSVFLHLRVVINMHGYKKDTYIYRILSLCNIGTFIVFRFFVIAWMTRWILDHRENLNSFFYIVGTCGLATLFVMSMFLFYRILVADNFFPAVKKEKQNFLDDDESSDDVIVSHERHVFDPRDLKGGNLNFQRKIRGGRTLNE